ncbi:MAG: FAD-dependent oxidoreductase [Erysipelothrix sp.]|nr:FAD-dependent oxidoreductase [Erysipelothrix sp.]
MKIIIIGAVAGGTTAATKIRRKDEQAIITMYERDVDISYSGCSLPYFIGDKITDLNDITPRDVTFFKEKHNIDVFIQHEVLSIDPHEKKVVVKNLQTKEVFDDFYDSLIISTGASVFVPPIQGIDSPHVFFLRTVQDALRIKEYIKYNQVRHAVIAGSGFIGLEMCENLVDLGIDTKVVELADSIAGHLDVELSNVLQHRLEEKGIDIRVSAGISEIHSDSVLLTNGDTINTQMVIMATGVKPNVSLAKEAGIKLGETGAIQVNDEMRTSDPFIYSVGDCAETFDLITNKAVYRPLGSTANKMGRIVGDVITGGHLRYRGNLGTSIYKVFDLSVGSTGMTQQDAKDAGYDVQVVLMTKPNKLAALGGQEMVIKAVADKVTRQLLGVSIVGYEGVDKRLDVFVTLITLGAKVDELFHLDLAYSPPFSTAKDPVHYVGMVYESQMEHVISIDKLQSLGKVQLIDARSLDDVNSRGFIEGSTHIPHVEIREKMAQFDKDKMVVVYCNTGNTSNAVMNILRNNGFKKVTHLMGGHKLYKETSC